MLRLWLVIGCSAMLWAFGSILPAQTAPPITVRSGDHDGFSRLVLNLPQRVDWTLREVGRDRVLGLGGPGRVFDTDSVFARMQNQRISAVEPTEDGAGLRIGLGCACEVDVFWHGRAMLVVDVRDPPSGAATPATWLPGDVPDQPGTAGQLAADLTAQVLMPLLPMGAASRAVSEIDAGSSDEAGGTEADSDLGPARLQLSRQLARAASMGLLTARQEPLGRGTVKHTPSRQVPDVAAGEDDLDGADRTVPVVQAGLQLHAETSIDHEVLDHHADQSLTNQGMICLPDTRLAVADWGGTGRFVDQIGPARARLTGEFDRFSQQAVIDLARLYLHFGFGAEAAQVLRAAGATGEDAEIALGLARVMDGADAENTRLAGQLSCDSAAAFWSAMAYADLPSDASVNEDAILRTVNALPAHLRQHLAPRLARKFTAAGKPRMAERILRILERNGKPPSSEQGLARAEVDLAGGQAELADRALEDAVAANDQSSAMALLRRIDTRLVGGRPISRDLADLAGAYAHEHRDTPIGDDLARVYIEASAATGAFERSFAEKARLAPELPDAMRRHVSDTVMGLLAQKADDMTFLRYALDPKAQNAGDLGGKAGNTVAERLIALGFPQVAQAYVEPALSGPDQRDRQILRARIALAQDRPGQAQVELLGLVGEDVNRLRAKAQSMTGAFRAAHLLYVAGGDAEAARRAAMQAEDWDRAAALGDANIAWLAGLDDAEPEALETAKTLDDNRKLLEASEAVRSSVASLLTARPVDQIPEE